MAHESAVELLRIGDALEASAGAPDPAAREAAWQITRRLIAQERALAR
jgi:hypothetical protein